MGGASSSSVGLGESPEAEVRSYANYEPLNPLKKLELRHYGNYYEKKIKFYWTAALSCLFKYNAEEAKQKRQDHGIRMAVAERSGDRSATG